LDRHIVNERKIDFMNLARFGSVLLLGLFLLAPSTVQADQVIE